MEITEKIIDSQLIYEGKIIKVFNEKVLLPDGNASTRDIVRHKGACTILAEHGGKILFIRQFRTALNKVIYEIPAGCIEENENIFDCAARELNEETGYEACNIKHLSSIYSTPGFSDEIIHIFFTDDIIKTAHKKQCDADEFIDVYFIEKSKVLEMIFSGEINDAKTICAFLLYLNIK
jgi:ADP-ribose pyrophosphatase